MRVEPSQNPTVKNLRPTYDHLEIPSADCNQSPSQLKQQDQCSVSVSITDDITTEVLSFARKGDKFVLSEGQDPQRLWFNTGHGGSSQDILRVITVLGKFLATPAVMDSSRDKRNMKAAIPLLLSMYIVQGKAEDPIDGSELVDAELLAFLLKIYGDLTERDMGFIVPVLDVLAALLTDPQLSKLEIDRVAEILVVKRYKPPYKKLLDFTLAYRAGKPSKVLDDETQGNYMENLKSFLAQLIIATDQKEKFPSNPVIVKAAFAFRELTGANLCDALEKFDQQGLGGDFPLGENAIKQCREATQVKRPVLTTPAKPIVALPSNSQPMASLNKIWRNAEIGLGAGGAVLMGLGGGLTTLDSRAGRGAGGGLTASGAAMAGCSLGSLVRLSRNWKEDAKKHNISGIVGCAVGGFVGGSVTGLAVGLVMRQGPPSEVIQPPADPGQKNPVQETGP